MDWHCVGASGGSSTATAVNGPPIIFAIRYHSSLNNLITVGRDAPSALAMTGHRSLRILLESNAGDLLRQEGSSMVSHVLAWDTMLNSLKAEIITP